MKQARPLTSPPRWARTAAHAAALTPLPSALWRIALVFGFSAGYTEQGLEGLNLSGWGWLYLVALSVVTEAVALLTLGLVQSWGEVVPHWVPLIGGRAVRPKPVVISAATILVESRSQRYDPGRRHRDRLSLPTAGRLGTAPRCRHRLIRQTTPNSMSTPAACSGVLRRWVPLAACVAALGYVAMKLVLAARGELGLPGFPAPARPGVDPAMAQLGNAALGVVGALLALMVMRRWRRPVQLGLAAAVGAAAALETFGAAVLVARAFGIADGFGTLPPGPGPPGSVRPTP